VPMLTPTPDQSPSRGRACGSLADTTWYSCRAVTRLQDEEEENLGLEEVERRRDLRAPVPGLRIVLVTPRSAAFEAVEASRRSFFVRAADPEAFRLGEVFSSRIERGARGASCRLEIIRKELHPRAGVALRLVNIDPPNEAVLREILGPLVDS
jgi:hypothetical protein